MFRSTAAILILLCAGALGAQNYTISSTPVSGLPDVDGKIWDVLENNGMLYIAGEFTMVGSTARNYLAEIDLSTNQVTSWNPSPDLFCTSLAVHNNVLYVGGGFTLMGSQARESLASFDLSSHALTGWNPTCALPYGASNIYFDDDVHCLYLQGDTLYAGGGFTAIDGTPRGHACSFDLNSLATANGLTAWDPNIIGSISTGSPSFGVGGVQGIWIDTANDLCIMTGGILEAGGNHWHDGSSSGHASVYDYAIVAQASGTGAPVATWTPTFNTSGALGNTLVVNTAFGVGSQAYISGLFASIVSGGVSESRFVAAGLDLTADTSTQNCVTAFDPNPDMRIWSWETDGTGSVVFAGGEFSTIGGQSYARLAMLDPVTGSALGSWAPAPDGVVRAIDFAGSRLYVAGEFTQIGGVAHQRLAAFDITYPVNNAPTLGVTSNGVDINQGNTINVAYNSSLSALNIMVNVDDVDGDVAALSGTISNIGTTGIIVGEFANSATGPYSVNPTSGVFDAGGVTHLVSLVVDDGNGGTTSLSFSIVVDAAPGGNGGNPSAGNASGGSSGGGGGCTTGGQTGAWLLLALASLGGICALRRRFA